MTDTNPPSDSGSDVEPESGSNRRPRVRWLAAAGVLLVVLAVIGWLALGSAGESANPGTSDAGSPVTSAASPPRATTATDAESGHFPPWTITRAGNGLVVAGVLPDEQERSGLVGALTQVIPGALLKNELTVAPGVKSPDAAGFGSLFGALASIPDFGLVLRGDTLTLTGTARTQANKGYAEESATAAFPNVKVVNDIEVKAASNAAPSRAQPCATLRADIDEVLRTPITFASDGVTLTPAAATLVAAVAHDVAACPAARVAVVGHTDDTGNAQDNVDLSTRRAKTVADALVSQGVAPAGVTSSGAGSSNPVASNATADGRAKNRRVEITVSQPG